MSDLAATLAGAAGLLVALGLLVVKIFGSGKKAGAAEHETAARKAATKREEKRREIDDDVRVVDAARELRRSWRRDQ